MSSKQNKPKRDARGHFIGPKSKAAISKKCPTCEKQFTTTDTRQIYCSRACGNTKRSQRWYKRAKAAMRQSAQQQKREAIAAA